MNLGKPRIRFSLPPEGVVFVIILGFVAVCSILRNVNLLVVVSGMMFLPLLFCWRISRQAVRNVIVQRSIPMRIHAGQPTDIRWKITNANYLKLFRLKITDSLVQVFSRNGSIDRPRWSRLRRKSVWSKGNVMCDKVAPSRTLSSSFQVFFSERGLYETGPAIIESSYPLGLIKSWFRLDRFETFHVAPKLGALANDWVKILTSSQHGGSSRSNIEGANDEEFFSIREWRSGDNPRKIHWRTTAKYQQPMVKQFDRMTEQKLAIVLDLYADPARSSGHQFNELTANCEAMLSFLATVVAQWEMNTAGGLVFSIAGMQPETLASFHGSGFAEKSMRALSIAQPSNGNMLQSAIESVIELTQPGTPCLIISPRSLTEGAIHLDPGVLDRTQWITMNSREMHQAFSLGGKTDRATVEQNMSPLLDAK